MLQIDLSKALELRILWLLKKALPSREEPDISLSIMNSKAHFHLARYARIISPKRGSDFFFGPSSHVS